MSAHRFLASLMDARARHHLLLVVVLVVAGCGTLTINMRTTVESETSFSQELEITASGMLGEMMATQFDVIAMRAEGWEAQLSPEDDVVTITASGSFSGEEARQFGSSGEDNPFEGFRIEVTDNPDNTEYRISLEIESTQGSSEVTVEGDPFAGFGESMLQSMAGTIQVNWELNAPGEIVETNADSFEGGKADWHLNLLDLQKTQELYAISRVKKRSGPCTGPIPRN